MESVAAASLLGSCADALLGNTVHKYARRRTWDDHSETKIVFFGKTERQSVVYYKPMLPCMQSRRQISQTQTDTAVSM